MKIIFKYGCMNSGKTMDLIKIAYNYKEKNINAIVLKPELDQRAKNKIVSRTGLILDAIEIKQDDCIDILQKLKENQAKVYLIDEANFLTKEAIDIIINYGYDHQVETLIFFGLKTDFKGNLFPGSKRLLERADNIEENTTLCWCGKKARQNGRLINNKLVKEGPTILVDIPENQVEYLPLCNYHYYKGIIAQDEI